MKSSNREEFIRKALIIHQNKYDYSKVNYLNARTKVSIICPNHGEFLQLPNDHLSNHGCKKCVDKVVDTSSFIRKSNLIHHHKYDYSLSNYISKSTKLIIICPLHGQFSQTPQTHYLHGCAKCSHLKKSLFINFINKAISIHQKVYDYSLTNYVNNYTHITIICPIHGPFQQIPSNHLAGSGCPTCGLENKFISKADFISRANVLHCFKYDYSLTNFDNYHNNRHRIKIICRNHGIFEQTVFSHLGGNGCKKCSHTISKKETDWLNSLNVPNSPKNRNVSFRINNKLFNVDGYLPECKIVYEFLGDFWHGNPAIYSPNDLNLANKKTFGELFSSTVERIRFLRKNGFKVISIWESRYKRKLK